MTLNNRQPADHELVTRTLAGDREAFGLLFDRYARVVRGTFVGLAGDDSTIHDLTQEVFLRAFRRLEGLKDRERFGAWLVGIARHVASEKRRSLGRDRHRFVAPETLRIEQNGDELQNSSEIKLVMEQLGRLPEREQLAIQLFFLEGQNAAATADLLGLSRSGLYALLKRACNQLAALVENPGHSQTGETP